MTSKEIRQSFLDFMASKGHKIVPSAPMVIKDDPTLMFTNAGMNQFKNIILGNDPIQFPRVADSQKCLRVSGKHNDLEAVGNDTYHHTMFEMLGNWSFGDYFKQGAIDFAWEYLTEVLHLDKDRLYVTVFEGSPAEGLERDDEAAGYWSKHLSADRIINGNHHDNFWEMGDTGPCGPCSEIHIDLRDESERAKISGRDLVNQDNPQVIEIWNIVFMQYYKKADGTLETLPNKVIDTGMGFERLCMALQGKQSNYDTDVFQPMLRKIAQICSEEGQNIAYGQNDKTDVAMRVIADHIRTISFAITDGQLPGNAKAGYVIRRILRRAVRYGYTFLNQKEAFLYKLVPQLVEDMGEAYPELQKQQSLIEKVIKEEEEAFLRTLDKGISLLEKLIQQADGKTISGKDTFTLYDTYGFPLDLTELILRENGMTANEDEFNAEMQKQKERARNAAKSELGDWVELHEGETEFVGYDLTECETHILRYRTVRQQNKEFYQIVLAQTPFYAEMGGQIGDTGWLGNVQILNTKRENNLPVHIATELPDNIEGTLLARINTERRERTACNHTATHLLHLALRTVLGEHVEQKGSLVTPDSLRFDFSHFQKVTPEELRKVEILANQLVRKNFQLEESRHTPIQKAKEMGAMALFGEKYGDDVRVIKYGESIELCGGTHVTATGNIGSIRIVMETSVAAGIRRIEAVTGEGADKLYYMQQDTLQQLRGLFNNAPDLTSAIQKFIEENASLKEDIKRYIAEKTEQFKEKLLRDAQDINGVKLITIKGEVNPDMLRNVLPMLRGHFTDIRFAVVGGTTFEGKPMISVFLSQPMIQQGLHAGNLVKSAAKHIQGGGGGQPFMATAGGKNPEGLQAAIDEILAQII
ncbi:MAG: alanine--tRNA ligase [Paludibacter sp.]|nr:alanine--tRNA ligase [Bacteroidales bacterium]MCM1068930.1 alanine--tRNA ligase [Prevotella sp.]MCM1353191.1 alanine--tRNA ligase [Bacteroides sp.]MCM1442513.1 alanine--tRNA ligase [Muribaculum sp.]MCM1481356.1 alanine--tRNA ligase [Paludibacter sp.]